MSSFAGMLTRYHALPIVSQRAVSAVVGAFVADAATRPTHWVYDRAVIESTIGDANPEFWHESLSPFYTLPTGRRSCYSDEGFTMLQSLLPAPHVFTKASATASLQSFFSPESEYAEALTRRLKAYDPSQRTAKRDPIVGPWQQAVVTHYLKAHTPESTSAETDGFCFALPLIATLSARDDADFETTVKAAVQILTTSDSAVVHSAIRARILRGLIRAGAADADSTTVTTSASAVATAGPAQRRALVDAIIVESEDDLVAAEWEAVLRSIPAQDGTALTMTAAGTLATGTDNSEVSVWGPGNLSPAFLDAVATFGKACADPGNFQSALLALVTCTSFTEGVRRNLLAGGCNCSRANFLGACLGAAYGLDTGAAGGEGEEEKEKGVKGTARGIPLSWIAKTDKGVEVLEMTLGLFE